MVLQAIKYSRGKLEILDQLRLPHEEVFIDIETVQHAWDAIHSMQVRGAPAIAIVAALSVAVSLSRSGNANGASRLMGPDNTTGSGGLIVHNLRFLLTSRPTAVNLGDAVRKLEKVVQTAEAIAGATDFDINEAYIRAAEQMLVDDVRDNEKIGRFGADWILRHSNSIPPAGKISVITHCNTGSLATAGYGTALGIIRSLHARNRLARVYYTETRPYNQGSRLTGYELLHDGIPATLITDSMAGALLGGQKKQKQKQKRDGSAAEDDDNDNKIACVIVGADRVAANGDTANKIGTYGLALLASCFPGRVNFVVAAPRTTIDMTTASGADIPIEERPTTEVTTIKGRPVTRVDGGGGGVKAEVGGAVREIAVAADLTGAWNPAFDVTGHGLIDCIVTEKGVVEKGEDGAFHLDEIFDL